MGKTPAKAQAMSTNFLSTLAPTAAVALGGAIGAAARYQVGLLTVRWAAPGSQFPWGTLTVNIAGSFIMGALLGWFARGGGDSENLRVFIIAGILGGFTTFSAFSAELLTMLHRGQGLLALGYGTASIVAGVAACLIGLIAAQMIGMGAS